jgi:AcrR family transcriptional regulator
VARIGEPQNARSRRTRTALLDGARRLLEDEGSGALTMERVAAEAGVSRRSAYLHVASRGELLLALLEHTDATEGLAESLRPVAEAVSVPARIDAWARHVASYHRRILPVVRAVDAARRADPDLQVVWDTAMQRWAGGCHAVAEEAEAAGALAEPWDASTAADLLWALMGVELLEDLVVDRGWSEQLYADRLALLARRTLLRDPSAD